MSKRTPSHKSGGCPLCGEPVAAAFAPFCSSACRDRDLLQWLGDGYRIPGPPLDSDPEDQGGETR